MKKILLVFAVFVLMTGLAQSQDKPASTLGFTPSSYYTFAWNTTFTMGDFNKWVSGTSPAGFDFGGRYFINNGLAVGFNLSWQRVSQIYTDETFTIPDKGIAINAENYRFTWMVPFQAVVDYHFMSDKMISPYIGLGIGGDYMEHHLLIQEYDIYKTRWDFSLTPEVGALVKFGNYSQWGALVAFNYKWTTNKIELYETASKDLQMLNLKIGLAMIIR
ncbi:MAG: outer membrane beta-barrel protein [Bacteroidetes bacterium]|nr:outer membrane beta-barrel protein [Bacteroidota bacterium]